MEIDIDNNIVNIILSEEEADKIKEIDRGTHKHFEDNDKEIIINKK